MEPIATEKQHIDSCTLWILHWRVPRAPPPSDSKEHKCRHIVTKRQERFRKPNIKSFIHSSIHPSNNNSEHLGGRWVFLFFPKLHCQPQEWIHDLSWVLKRFTGHSKKPQRQTCGPSKEISDLLWSSLIQGQTNSYLLLLRSYNTTDICWDCQWVRVTVFVT